MLPEAERPVLYSFRRCPYAIRARLALRYAGLQCELREVVLKNKPPEMLHASPKATVPVLVLNGGEVIDESLEIMLWALAQHDPDGWLDVDRQLAGQLIDANDDQFKPWLDRYKYPNRYPDLHPDEARPHCEFYLQHLEERLSRNDFLCGERASFVDFALYPFVRQYAFVDITAFRAGSFGKLSSWLDMFLESGLFGAVMQKFPPWQQGARGVVF